MLHFHRHRINSMANFFHHTSSGENRNKTFNSCDHISTQISITLMNAEYSCNTLSAWLGCLGSRNTYRTCRNNFISKAMVVSITKKKLKFVARSTTIQQAVVRMHNKPRPRVAHLGIVRFLGIGQKCNHVIPWSLHTFHESFMQISPAVGL